MMTNCKLSCGAFSGQQCEAGNGEILVTGNRFAFFSIPGSNSKDTWPFLEVTVRPEGTNGAHIILTPHKTYNRRQRDIYYIVIGGWSNTKSAIMKGYEPDGSKFLATYEEQNLVSDKEYRTFYIWVEQQGKDITIKVGKKWGTHFMEANDNNAPGRKYIGLGSNGEDTAYYKLEAPGVYLGGNYKQVFFVFNKPKLTFQVKTPKSVVIWLSPTEKLGSQFYEIIFGWPAGSPLPEGLTVIKDSRLPRDARNPYKWVAKKRAKGLVSASEFKSFWLSVDYVRSNYGEVQHLIISVGKEGEEVPFIQHTDKNPILDANKFVAFTNWRSMGEFKDIIATGDEGTVQRIF